MGLTNVIYMFTYLHTYKSILTVGRKRNANPQSLEQSPHLFNNPCHHPALTFLALYTEREGPQEATLEVKLLHQTSKHSDSDSDQAAVSDANENRLLFELIVSYFRTH